MAKQYNWTHDQIDSLHPYWVLVYSGWRPVGSQSVVTNRDRARKLLEQKRERAKGKELPRPPHYPEHLPWPARSNS